MKKAILLLTLLGTIVSTTSCSSGKGKLHTVTILMDSTCNSDRQTAAYEVINKRIVSLWNAKEKTALTDGCFSVTCSADDSLLTRLLEQRGEVYVSETYRSSELWPAVVAVYEEMTAAGEQPLWAPYGDSGDIPILLCPPQQVAHVDSVFNNRKHLFPADAFFCWTAVPDKRDTKGNEYFELLALKRTGRKLPLNPLTVKRSDYEGDPYGGIDEYRAINMELNAPYDRDWARLTRDNISNSLAFVMDGKVLMFPTVHDEIIGGKMQITGKMDAEEFLLIKAAVSGGVLDCTARIVGSVMFSK